MPKKLIILNFILFQVGWFACILGASHGYAWAGPVYVIGFLLLHLRSHHSWQWEWPLLAAGLLVGFLFDTLMIILGIHQPMRAWLPAPLTTVWLLAMWMNFVITLNVSLRTFQQHLFLAAVFGALAGPAAYYGGQKLGAIQIQDPLFIHLFVLAAGWMLVTPALLWIAKKARQRYPSQV